MHTRRSLACLLSVLILLALLPGRAGATEVEPPPHRPFVALWEAVRYRVTHGEPLARYGNWYGPGWWGGGEDRTTPGPLAPVDSLDAVAQRHDMAWWIAEQQGKLWGPAEEYRLKAMADFIAVEEAKLLDQDPRKWPYPPKTAEGLAKAERYHLRIRSGFPYLARYHAGGTDYADEAKQLVRRDGYFGDGIRAELQGTAVRDCEYCGGTGWGYLSGRPNHVVYGRHVQACPKCREKYYASRLGWGGLQREVEREVREWQERHPEAVMEAGRWEPCGRCEGKGWITAEWYDPDRGAQQQLVRCPTCEGHRGRVESLVDVRVEGDSPPPDPEEEQRPDEQEQHLVMDVAGVWEIRILGETTLTQRGTEVSGTFGPTPYWPGPKKEQGGGTLTGTLTKPPNPGGLPSLDMALVFEGHWEHGGERGRLVMTFGDPALHGPTGSEDRRLWVSGGIHNHGFVFDQPVEHSFINGVRVGDLP